MAVVLLVEDDDVLRAVLEKALRPEFEVRSCANGLDAIAQLGTGDVDVVLTDLGLPGAGGEVVARTARRLTPPLPVVVMSGDEERLEASRPLADALVPKPFAAFDTVAIVRRVLQQAGPSTRRSGPRQLTLAVIGLAFAVSSGCQLASRPSEPEGLAGHWTLSSLSTGTGPLTPPPAGAAFTADFGGDGHLALQADCNRCSAGYTSGDGELAVGVTACTRAACPSAPYDYQYASLVSEAQRYTVEDGVLELRSASGRLLFRR